MGDPVAFFAPIDTAFESLIENIGESYIRYRKIFIWLIAALATIQIGIHLVRFGLHGKSDESPVGFLLKFAFWYVVIFFTPEIMHTVQSTFVRLGAIGSDSEYISLPSAILRAGWQASVPIMDIATTTAVEIRNGFWGKMNQTLEIMSVLFANLPKIAIAFVVWVLILACYVLILAQVFLAYVEFAILGAAAAILFPFGIFKYTSFVTEKLVGAIISHGVKLLLLQFIIGIGLQIFSAESITSSATVEGMKYGELIAGAVNAMLFAVIVMNVPSMATGIISGQPSLSGASIQQTAAAGAVAARGVRNTGRAAGALAAGAVTGGIAAIGGTTRALGAAKSAGEFYKGTGAGLQAKAVMSAFGGTALNSMGNTARQAGSSMWRRLGVPSSQAGRMGLRQIARNRRTQSSGMVDYMRRSASEGSRRGEQTAIRMGKRMEDRLMKKERKNNA